MQMLTHNIYVIIISSMFYTRSWHFRDVTTYFKRTHASSNCTDIQHNLEIKPPGFSGFYHIGLRIRKAIDD